MLHAPSICYCHLTPGAPSLPFTIQKQEKDFMELAEAADQQTAQRAQLQWQLAELEAATDARREALEAEHLHANLAVGRAKREWNALGLMWGPLRGGPDHESYMATLEEAQAKVKGASSLKKDCTPAAVKTIAKLMEIVCCLVTEVVLLSADTGS